MPLDTYNEYHADLLTKDVLIEDEDFLQDASSFLERRQKKVYTDPEEIYDNYLSHMRESEVNEAVTYGDWMYVSEIKDDDEKKRAARLYHTFDRMNSFEGKDVGDVATAIADYGMGIISAPSTYIGILSGGSGKVAITAGQQVAKHKVRKELFKKLLASGAKRAAVVEGTIGAVQDVGNQAVRMEVDDEREFSGTQLGVSTGVSALTGGVLSLPNSYFQSRSAIQSERLKNIGERRTQRALTEAVEAAKETVSKATYRPLDDLKVELGDAVREGKLEDLTGTERVFVGLDDDTFARIQAAAIEVIGDIKPKTYSDGTKQRITEAVGDAISSGKFKEENLIEVLNKYKLTNDQFGMIYIADVSRAAKVLNTSSQIKRFKTMADNMTKIVNENSELININIAQEFDQTSKLLTKISGQGEDVVKSFDRFRRAVLTTQIQTTQRNFTGGALRVTMDALDTFFDSSYKGIVNAAAKMSGVRDTNLPFQDRVQLGDTLAAFKYMLKPAEAEVILSGYRAKMPAEADRLLSTFIDSSKSAAITKTGRGLQRIGMQLNVLNRFADNFVKRAAFAGELSRLTRAKYGKDALDMFVDGKFGDIDESLFVNATEKAYDLVYQAEPTDFISKKYLEIDRSAFGIVLGTILPYPRFVSNQIRFMTEYNPFTALVADKYFKRRKGSYSSATKFASGSAVVASLAAFRATQPVDSEWWSYTKDDGTNGDLRPTLAGFSSLLYLSDLIMKDHYGIPNDWTSGKLSKILAEVRDLSFGTSFRSGFSGNMFDEIVPDFTGEDIGSNLSIKTEKALGQFLGDLAAPLGYNLISGTARDIFQLTDEEARYVPETNGEYNTFDIFVMRATRGLPAPMRPESRKRYTITSSLPTKTESPLGAMATGINIQRPKNQFEKELSYHGLTSYDLYKPVPFGPLDVRIKEELSKTLPDYMTDYINTSSKYKNQVITDAERKKLLVTTAREKITEVKSAVTENLYQEAVEKGDKELAKTVRRFEFESTSTPDIRKSVFPARYRQKYNKTFNLDKMTADEIKLATEYLKVVDKFTKEL